MPTVERLQENVEEKLLEILLPVVLPSLRLRPGQTMEEGPTRGRRQPARRDPEDTQEGLQEVEDAHLRHRLEVDELFREVPVF